MAPNEGRNNWCHSRLRDFDFETFRDFFRLRDQKTSGAMAPVAPPSSAPLIIYLNHHKKNQNCLLCFGSQIGRKIIKILEIKKN